MSEEIPARCSSKSPAAIRAKELEALRAKNGGGGGGLKARMAMFNNSAPTVNYDPVAFAMKQKKRGDAARLKRLEAEEAARQYRSGTGGSAFDRSAELKKLNDSQKLAKKRGGGGSEAV
mmetsp:Transcript_18793/g.38174  ORF Transcript_18793/g.38174 Transcript_18793/m.38174 type:complete len:119 (+) Transcript_18793:87-443(+)